MSKSKHILIDSDEFQVLATRGYEGTKVTYHYRRAPNHIAMFAMDLLRVHAGITARENGQDDAGRAKVRRDMPAEAVIYACETAAAAFAEFEDRGWLISVPGWDEIEEKAKPEN